MLLFHKLKLGTISRKNENRRAKFWFHNKGRIGDWYLEKHTE